MRWRFPAGLVVLGSLILTTPAIAQQSLADIARAEKARRAAIADDERAKVYTDDDLRGGPRLTTATSPARPADAAGNPPSAVVPPITEAEAELERGEEYWRERITTAREAKQRAELFAAALQNRVDGLWAQFTARDDPIQRALIEQDRLEALDGLATTRAEIERLDQEIRDIEEEARRAGALPGWLR